MIEEITFNMEINFEDTDICDIAFQSLLVESKYNVNERAIAVMDRKDNHLILQIKAKDAVSARAAVNSYLKWLNLSLEIIEKTDAKKV